MIPFLADRCKSPGSAGTIARRASGCWRTGCLTTLWISLWLSLALFGLEATAQNTTAQETTAQQARDTVTVLAAGDLRGEIKPCGCSPEGQMGGLQRRLSYLEQNLGRGTRGQIPLSQERPHRERTGATAPILVDLGNNFPEPTAQGRFKIELIDSLLGKFPPAAILPGPGELRAGVAGLSSGLPYVLGNDSAGKRFAAVVRVRRQGRTIAIHGYLSPSGVYQDGQSHFRLEPAAAFLKKIPRPKPGETALLLFRGSDEELATFHRSGKFALIIAGNPSADELQQITERKIGVTSFPQVPTKGQGLLRIQLNLSAPDGKAPHQAGTSAAGTTGESSVDWLKENWPDHPAAAPVFAKYDERVKGLFFARMEIMERQQRESPFAGAQACQACHLSAHEAWKKSRHAGALATLEKVGKQFDPECLACHVVGLEKGGFISKELTPALANVQCENCHGPGKDHARNPAQRTGPPVGVSSNNGAVMVKPDMRTCRTCHRGSHSPTFAFSVYWPKVIHSK